MNKNLFFGLFLLVALITACAKPAPSNGTGEAMKSVEPTRERVPIDCVVDTSQDTPALVATWNSLKEKELKELTAADGWGTPESVKGNVNSIGWEDSAFISPDGNTLYFQYLRGDMFHTADIFKYHTPKAQGGLGEDPKEFANYHRGPARNVTPAYSTDVLTVGRASNRFCNLQRFAYSQDGRSEWGAMLAADGAWYYNVDVGGNVDIYRDGKVLEIPGYKQYREDNPHFIVTKYGNELFFDSDNRPPGNLHIWVTKETKDGWTEPIRVAAPINTNDAETQPFLTPEGKLYFSSSRGGAIGIWESDRLGEDSWSKPKRVLWPTKSSGSHLFGVGEPTLTADGTWLYAVAIFEYDHDGKKDFDADVIRVAKK